jgi:hypothetical protein
MVPIRSGVVWKAYPEVPIHPSSAQHARLLKEAPQPHSATPPQSHHREPSTVLSQQDFSTETSRHRGSVGVCLPQCPLHHGLPWPLFSQDATTGIVGLGQSHMGDRSVHIFVTLLMASSACARWDWERCPLYGHWTDIADALMAIVGCSIWAVPCHMASNSYCTFQPCAEPSPDASTFFPLPIIPGEAWAKCDLGSFQQCHWAQLLPSSTTCSPSSSRESAAGAGRREGTAGSHTMSRE